MKFHTYIDIKILTMATNVPKTRTEIMDLIVAAISDNCGMDYTPTTLAKKREIQRTLSITSIISYICDLMSDLELITTYTNI